MIGLWRDQISKDKIEVMWEEGAESGVIDVMGYLLPVTAEVGPERTIRIPCDIVFVSDSAPLRL